MKNKEKVKMDNIIVDIFNKENLFLMSGKVVTNIEIGNQIEIEYFCLTDEDLQDEETKQSLLPFLENPKKRNVIEFEESYPVLEESTFRRCMAKALHAETSSSDDFYLGETTLTILTKRKPEIPDDKYNIQPVNDWKYQSFWDNKLDTFIVVEENMKWEILEKFRDLLQMLESKPPVKYEYE